MASVGAALTIKMMNCVLPIARGTPGPTARVCGRGGAGIFRSQHTLETGGREEGLAGGWGTLQTQGRVLDTY